MDPPPPSNSAITTPASAAASGPPLHRHLINLDTNLSRNLHRLTKHLLPRFLFLLLELSADFRIFFPISLSLLLTPSPSANVLHRPFLTPLLLGSLLDLGLVGLIKILVRRSRPIYNHHASMSIAVSPDHYSFPSGHASRVFFVASLFDLSASSIGDLLKDLRHLNSLAEWWVGTEEGKAVSFVIMIFWLWAIATSVSRVLLGRHFVFDVLAGACLGVLEGLFAFHFLRF